jgi:hypothetical protein
MTRVDNNTTIRFGLNSVGAADMDSIPEPG